MSAISNRKRKPATTQRSNTLTLRQRLRAWRDLHLYGLISSIGRMGQRPWATLLTVSVMALAVALPMGLWLVLHNVEQFSGSVTQSRDISVFLRPQVGAERAQQLAQEIGQRAQVASVIVRSPEQGLAELRAMSELADALDVLEQNPLPYVLQVSPREDGDALAIMLRALPEAEIVQHDAQWRRRLDVWLGFGDRVVLVVALLLGAGALLVVGNTVRLDIQSRADEVSVLRLLGATDGFVRRPFLYLGACYGLGAGLLALLVLVLVAKALAPPLAGLVASYGSEFVLVGPGALGLLRFMFGVVLLGWIGAWLATGHHLHRTQV